MRRTLAGLCVFLPIVACGAAPQPVIDGDFSDWPAGVTVSSDGDDVRLLLSLPAARTIQGLRTTAALRIDIDGDESTGDPFGGNKGIDLSVVFSPPFRDAVGNGTAVFVHTAEGTARVKPAAIGLVVAPSHASDTYEIRLSRTAVIGEDDIETFPAPGELRWWLTPLNPDGDTTGVWSSGSGAIAPGTETKLADVTLPDTPENAVRIATINVLWASPMIEPAPFSRVMNAIDADVWLIQEWDIRERDQPRLPVAAIEEWLETRLEPASDWTVFAGDQRGVVVASRLPLVPARPGELKVTAIGDRRAMIERSVRYVSAIAETPVGKLLLASVHLKCCGTAGGDEDRQRIAESIVVNTALAEAVRQSSADGVVIGGDFNLVGSPMPLAIIKNGVDPDGGNLVESSARVLGDDAVYTHANPNGRFVSGRLDYMLSSPSSLRVAGSWIFDTAKLSDESLSAMGVMRGDSAATDHRPIVIDYVRAN